MFLIQPDFYQIYTETRFLELINSDATVWQNNLKRVIEDVSGYLRARYDVSKIFAELKEFKNTTAYVTGDRVYWYEFDYEQKTYNVGDFVNYLGSIYICITQITTPETFDPAKWTFKALNYSIYSCIADSTGNLPTDATYFEATDTRNSKVVEIVVDIVIYNLLNRLNNIDIPVNRKERYDGNDGKQLGGAIGWLKQVSKGYIEPDLPLREAGQTDQTGNKIIYGYAEDITDKNLTF